MSGLETKININKKLLAYIKYLKRESAINEFYGLDSTQIQVLNAIVIALSEKRNSSVGDLLQLSEIASPATIHAALKKLAAKELITHKKETHNRLKIIQLTEIGLQRFNDLAKASAN